jgi:hypothetical protein
LLAIEVASPPNPGALEHMTRASRKNDSREPRTSRDTRSSRARCARTDEKPAFGTVIAIQFRRLPSAASCGFARARAL